MKLKLFVVEREIKAQAWVAAPSAEEALVVAEKLCDECLFGEHAEAREDFAREAHLAELQALSAEAQERTVWLNETAEDDGELGESEPVDGPTLADFREAMEKGDGTIDDEEEEEAP